MLEKEGRLRPRQGWHRAPPPPATYRGRVRLARKIKVIGLARHLGSKRPIWLGDAVDPVIARSQAKTERRDTYAHARLSSDKFSRPDGTVLVASCARGAH